MPVALLDICLIISKIMHQCEIYTETPCMFATWTIDSQPKPKHGIKKMINRKTLSVYYQKIEVDPNTGIDYFSF